MEEQSRFAGLTSKEVLTIGRELAQSIEAEIGKVVYGPELKPLIRDLVVARFVPKGHVMVRAQVGVAKTLTCEAYARATAGQFRKIQCRADMLPTEVTGHEMPNLQTGEIEFHHGPLFGTNVLLVDEINRATGKAQAPFLEAMENQSLTVGAMTFKLKKDLLVLATRNPQEHEAVYDLPEAQLDRFCFQAVVEDPSEETVMLILADPDFADPADDRLARITPVITPDEILTIRKAIKTIHVEERLDRYIVKLRIATGKHPLVEFGASPRGAICLKRAAQVEAFLQGRSFATPEDVQRHAVDILSHRIFKTSKARNDPKAPSTREIVKELIAKDGPNEVKFD